MRSDGKAVEVELTATTEKGTQVYLDDFFGITMQSGSSGEDVAIEIAQREHELVVDSELTGVKGEILYINSDGEITNDDTDVPFMKVTVAKDANNYIWGILLPQKTE